MCPTWTASITFLDIAAPKTAAVIGGGFIGLEMAEAFHRRGMHVTVIEKFPHILPLLDDDMATASAKSDSRARTSPSRPAQRQRAFMRQGVELADGGFVSAELILLSVGVRAEVGLAKDAGIEIGVTGGVKVNARMESSDPDIYAVGDAAETTHSLPARARVFRWPGLPTARAASRARTPRADISGIPARWAPRSCASCI